MSRVRAPRWEYFFREHSSSFLMLFLSLGKNTMLFQLPTREVALGRRGGNSQMELEHSLPPRASVSHILPLRSLSFSSSLVIFFF
ncbi:hypothetical protein IE53DRAFT_247325 [Violaceomyces palustris]|uniref:Uncharacterized protein n=1 Tax=Violaceomyces palustris TaxID=1673888 RepID=A0ACD0NNZ1_9BASI|nr:hypothetical protein IE53DRAFT_247325 [Violaceomyces palustris]